MNVQDLITALQGFPSDAKVLVSHEPSCQWAELNEIEEAIVDTDDATKTYVTLFGNINYDDHIDLDDSSWDGDVLQSDDSGPTFGEAIKASPHLWHRVGPDGDAS